MVTLFWVMFAVTLALFAVAVWTGRTGRRRAHFIVAPAAIVALLVTIRLTRLLVAAYDLPERELGIHLWFAKSAAALLVPVVATGLWTLRQPHRRGLHRAMVWAFLAAVVVATATGLWVFSLATPK